MATATSSPNLGSCGVFRFFDLPRELRDMVYLKCAIYAVGGWPVFFGSGYRTNSLKWKLVCRQMKDEGMLVMAKNIRWQVSTGDELALIKVRILQDYFEEIRSIELSQVFFGMGSPMLSHFTNELRNLRHIETTITMPCLVNFNKMEKELVTVARGCKSLRSMKLTSSLDEVCCICNHCFREAISNSATHTPLCRLTNDGLEETNIGCESRIRVLQKKDTDISSSSILSYRHRRLSFTTRIVG